MIVILKHVFVEFSVNLTLQECKVNVGPTEE